MSQAPRWNKQLALALALLLLGGITYWLEFKQRPKREETEELSKRLFSLKDESFEWIRFSGERTTLHLVCEDFANKLCKPGDNSKWKINEPMKVRADDGNVNSLVSGIANITAKEVIDLKDETPEKRQTLLREYGLDVQARSVPSFLRLSVKAGGKEHKAYLGLNHPIGDGFFALAEVDGKTDETKVFILPNYFRGNFEHDLGYWRDKKILTWGAHEIASFTLEGSKARVQGTRKEGQWTLRNLAGKNEEFPGDLENIDSLMSAAAFLSAKGFVAESQSEFKAKQALNSTKQLVKLTLAKADGQSVTVRVVGKDKPKVVVFATVTGMTPLYELEAASKDRIDKDLKDLRLAKLVTSVERYTARYLEFSGKTLGAQPIKLQNDLGKWSRSDKVAIDSDRVQLLLDRISGNRIRDFVSGPPPAGDDQGLTLTLSTEDTPGKRKYLFWRANSNLYARDLNSKRREVLLIDPATSEGLPWDPNHFAPQPGDTDKKAAAAKK